MTQKQGERDGRTIPASTKVTINLPERTYQDLSLLALETDSTMKELVREALGVVSIAADEARLGNRLAIVSQDGTVLRELVLSRYEALRQDKTTLEELTSNRR